MRKREHWFEKWANLASISPKEEYDTYVGWEKPWTERTLAANAFIRGGRQILLFDQSVADMVAGTSFDGIDPDDTIDLFPYESAFIAAKNGPFDGCVVLKSSDVLKAAEVTDVNAGDLFEDKWRPYLISRELQKQADELDGVIDCSEQAGVDVYLYYLSLIMYVCCVNGDINTVYTPPKGVRPNPKKRRSMATWHEVGYRIGAELREYERMAFERKPHQGGTVRPHMRRAHWHHYWTGPLDGERELVLKWVAPTLVASKNGEPEATGRKAPVMPRG